ncbi:hypothetical protein PPERSA_07533 [Pseudocohnilembus persalinus]|uniref:Uncharacterized protein n=1 Tax=Pseudocohnilembus persalinus TaxID=266149 RepID=A0A0V0QZQ0_PSEPJ|nr:hypothetical protein PPERSA_07533 [Pseudocohnilembus persalinus]|eukprot:KRX07783.1 hypothetical protein PPERSA_07533 [Pseudocohnilembus persalinus]
MNDYESELTKLTELNISLEKLKKRLTVENSHNEQIYQRLTEEQEELELLLQMLSEEVSLKEEIQEETQIKALINKIKESNKQEDLKKEAIDNLQNQLHQLQRSQKLKIIIEVLMKFNFDRMKVINKNLDSKNQQVYCIRCKDLFTPSQNSPNACFYHPGRLKFYSCRGCGANDYYTCCQKCTKCVKGCMNGSHVQ